MSKPLYKNYMLGLLTLVGVYNYIDRMMLSLMLEGIKQDLDLSDSQLGLLSGIAFALFYAAAAIPIARWSDKGDRSLIVTVTTALWSGMVALCGLVGSFSQLLLVRVGVAIGEAGCLPPAQSLIAEYFDRGERPRAMAMYWLCAPIAVIVGYLIGGWLIDQYGWRTTFIIMGLPGLVLAGLVKLTLREPRKSTVKQNTSDSPTFRAVLITLWQEKTYRTISIAFCIAYFFGFGIFQWLPTFFIRSHGMSVTEVGAWFAFSWGVCGLVGGYLGGVLVSKFMSNQEGRQMRGIAVIFILQGLLFAAVCFSASQVVSLVCLSALGVLIAIPNGAVFSAIQSLVNDRMRSVAIALLFFFSNLVGYGLGPLAVGFLSDGLASHFGDESLRYALVAFSPGYMLVAFFYWSASRSIDQSIDFIDRQPSLGGCVDT